MSPSLATPYEGATKLSLIQPHLAKIERESTGIMGTTLEKKIDANNLGVQLQNQNLKGSVHS